MSIVRWDPFRNMSALQERINKVFEESINRSGDMEDDHISMCAWKPVVDIFEKDKIIVIRAEIPGVKKEDVSVEVKDNILTLKGERKPDNIVDEKEYYRRERIFGKFHRAFTMQDFVEPESISAKIADGVLEVTLPRPEEEKPRQVKVKID